MAIYFLPWIALQVKWPIFVSAADVRLPPVGVTLSVGLGGLLVLALLLAITVPAVLRTLGATDLARIWRQGALRALGPGIAVTAVHVGMRLPLPLGLQIAVTAAVALLGALALSSTTK